MPIGVMITQSEVEAARAAEVGTLNGNFFEYDPRETLALIEKITEAGGDGADRLVTRMADIYGKTVATKAQAQAEAPADEGEAAEPDPVKKEPRARKVYVSQG